MSYLPPNKIKILSDNNEIKLINTIPKNKNQKECVFKYKFIKSVEKLNLEVDFTEVELNKNLGNFFKVIE